MKKPFGKLRKPTLGALPERVHRLGKAGEAVYASREWQLLSAQVRRVVRSCMACGAKGRMYVDHVVELQDGGAPYDPRNLQVLCAKCHARKTYNVALSRAGGSPGS
jgi:5-methylcytosine-specific restriction enzyme A